MLVFPLHLATQRHVFSRKSNNNQSQVGWHKNLVIFQLGSHHECSHLKGQHKLAWISVLKINWTCIFCPRDKWQYLMIGQIWLECQQLKWTSNHTFYIYGA
jgi:hypothetical protein